MIKSSSLVLSRIVNGVKRPDTTKTVEIRTLDGTSIATAVENPAGSGYYAVSFTTTDDWGFWYVDGVMQPAYSNNSPFYLGPFDRVYVNTLNVTGSSIIANITSSGGLLGTASHANRALTASLLLGSVVSSSFAATASLLLGSVVSSSYAATASLLLGSVVSSSYAASASTAANSILFNGKDSATFAVTGSNTFIGNQVVTGSTTVSGTLFVTGSVSGSGGIYVAGDINALSLWSSTGHGQFTTTPSLILGSAFTRTAVLRMHIIDTANYVEFEPLEDFTAIRSIRIPNFDGTLMVLGENNSHTGSLTISGSFFTVIAPTVITSSLTVSGSTTSSLGFYGTASHAVSALTASLLLGSVVSSSYAATASLLLGSVVSASYAATASLLLGSVVSSSYASTASFVTLAASSSWAVTASRALTGPFVLPAQTSSFVTNAMTSSFLPNAQTGSLVKNSMTSSMSVLSSSYSVTSSFALNALAITVTRGGTMFNSTGVSTGSFFVWRAPYSCTVTNVWGLRSGGSGATINARSGSANFLATARQLNTTDVWINGGAVQNTAFTISGALEIMIVSVTGSPTQIGVQVDFTKP